MFPIYSPMNNGEPFGATNGVSQPSNNKKAQQDTTEDWGLAEFYHPLNEYNVRLWLSKCVNFNFGVVQNCNSVNLS